ncbi:ABC transporter permease [Acidimicrobiia bacterium EGI L10123]|uniref:ABC transporter permease n=1 Tax=Salinilacustrithrix flava TaxID=2957203 RepID=UPI003D7C3427|nr:ABC transporter permease [Acidimicrobiia bacterium EGI L10123]
MTASTPDSAVTVARVRGRGLRRFARRFLRQRTALVAAGFLLLMVLVALFADVLAPHDPDAQTLRDTLLSPLTDGHVLGTDELGRDVLSRLIHAARVSLLAAVIAVSVGFVLGVPLGLISGYVGGWVDTVLQRITDAVMSFPPLILAIAVIAVLGPSLTNAMLAVGLVFAPRFLRLVRASVLSVREQTYIEAAKTIGTPMPVIVLRHVLPNVLSPMIVQMSLAAGFSLLAEAGLSFLGLGVQPPDSSWGSMMGRAFRELNQQTWLIVWPGLMIVFTVLAFNVLGDALSDALGREIREGNDDE